MATVIANSEDSQNNIKNENVIQVNSENHKNDDTIDSFFKKEEDKYPRMTKQYLRQHCKDLKLYVTPYLNDVLYLHFKGFSKIENLDEYTGLKCLWLESNGITKIENLNNLDLRCLFLQQNLIKNIENLSHLTNLSQINLSHNMIRKIENLESLPKLETLEISHNKLEDRESIIGLIDCNKISVLNLSHNLIDGEIIDIFSQMKSLKVLYLIGNPIAKNMRHYRKQLIYNIKNLTYLDDRPVFPRERACTEAWFVGGVEAETAERQLWINKENKKIRDSVDALAQLRKHSTAKRIEKELRDEHDKQGNIGPYPLVDVDSVCWLSGDYKLVESGENIEVERSNSVEEEILEDIKIKDINLDCEDVKDDMIIPSKETEKIEGIFGRRPTVTNTNMRFVLDACKAVESEEDVSVLEEVEDRMFN